MATVTTQPIAGVSASSENESMSVFPSIGSTGLGRAMGRLFNSIPLGNYPVRLSHLLFPLPASPIAAALYFWLKLTGQRFTLTNRAVVVKTALGRREVTRANLEDIADVHVVQQNGQQFYRCADLELLDSAGKPILRLPAIPHAEIFRITILKARDAASEVKSSLATIDARHSE